MVKIKKTELTFEMQTSYKLMYFLQKVNNSTIKMNKRLNFVLMYFGNRKLNF